jgi:hypothetical protein
LVVFCDLKLIKCLVFVTSRERVLSLLRKLNETLVLLQDFKTAIHLKHAAYDNICGRVQKAASPKQVAQFQLWLLKNVHLLANHVPNLQRDTHVPDLKFISNSNSNSNVDI